MDPSLLIMSGITYVQELHFASRYANAAIARQCDIPDRMPASVSQWDKRVAVGAARS